MANLNPKDAHAGLYAKFKVTRVDGRDQPGRDHEGCEYFPLDLTHDPHAIPALEAYERSCRASLVELAEDIRAKLIELRKGP